jgi:S-adenosylmethionine:tRNA ribosyltransferase-isomerase
MVEQRSKQAETVSASNGLQLSDFDYELPPELIARYPLDQRSASRLLCLEGHDGIAHRSFTDLSTLLGPHDLLVLNDTRVIPARWYARKETGGAVELLFERELGGQLFTAMARSSKPLREGARLQLLDRTGAPTDGSVTVRERGGALVSLELCQQWTFARAFEECGHVPIPPYFEREDQELDGQRYQTVYARYDGSVAAPTAGLHFDDALLKKIREQGVTIGSLTLHVGAGTFAPVRVNDVAQHAMHSERFIVSEQLAGQVATARARGGRVVAVGTTVVRALESAVDDFGVVSSTSSETQIFIYPGYRFRAVDAMITNFHLPQSTLLMLVSAFVGRERVLNAYREAVRQRYRFFSYGDAMWLSPASETH